MGPVNLVNHTSWVAVVTPTDRPNSVRNCYLINHFVALFVLSLCPFDISVGVGAFVIGLGQISSFLSMMGAQKDNIQKTIDDLREKTFYHLGALDSRLLAEEKKGFLTTFFVDQEYALQKLCSFGRCNDE